MSLVLIEFDEAVKLDGARPHGKIAINPSLVVSVQAITPHESRLQLQGQPAIVVRSPYQQVIDMLREAPRR